MVDSVNRRDLLRLNVRWLLTVKTEFGLSKGETRNITGEGFFLYCSERLHEGVAYPVTIKLPEKLVEMTGQVTWCNLDNCTSFNFSPAMGFYFMRIDEDKDKQILREAITAELKKPLGLRQQADRAMNSLLPGEEKTKARPEGTPRNPQVPRN